MFYCYMLKNTSNKYKNHTYIGYTNNPKKRIRQHNCELVGGAKYTHGKNNSWEYMALIEGFPTNISALQCEWRLKHPDNKKNSSKYSKINGRFRALNEVLQYKRWTSKSIENNSEYNYKLYIKEEYKDLVNINLPENINIIFTPNIIEIIVDNNIKNNLNKNIKNIVRNIIDNIIENIV